MGFVSPDHHDAHHHHHHHHHHNEEEAIGIRVTSDERPTSAHRRISTYDDSDADASELIHHPHSGHSPVNRHNGKSSSNSSSGNNNNNSNSHLNNVHSHNGHGRAGVVGVSGNSGNARFGQSSSPSPIESDSLGRDSPTGNASEIEQVEWLNELQSSGAKIVKVLFPRIANNDKELTVVR